MERSNLSSNHSDIQTESFYSPESGDRPPDYFDQPDQNGKGTSRFKMACRKLGPDSALAHSIERHPFTSVAVALAVGVVVGMLIPGSEPKTSNSWMGDWWKSGRGGGSWWPHR